MEALESCFDIMLLNFPVGIPAYQIERWNVLIEVSCTNQDLFVNDSIAKFVKSANQTLKKSTTKQFYNVAKSVSKDQREEK